MKVTSVITALKKRCISLIDKLKVKRRPLPSDLQSSLPLPLPLHLPLPPTEKPTEEAIPTLASLTQKFTDLGPVNVPNRKRHVVSI